jgi:LuxR family maltose regulon positive regulatory protein
MSTPILATKLYIPPPRRDVVFRPRLVERLDEDLSHGPGLGRKLTLTSAPAGFGKTTLISEWIAGCERPAAWLSLDEEDGDPARFLSYLIAALQTMVPGIGEEVLGPLQSPQPPPTKTVLTILLNDLTAISDHLVLVLDDYHVIDSPQVDEALTFLIEHLPPQIHLVITTREDPPFPLARLRARGQLTEIRAADLRFTTSEAAEFLNQVMNLDLSAADIAALEARTEGWIVGLQLAAISMRGREDPANLVKGFTGSHRFVLDYLIEEVLDRQPENVQMFLLQTAILDRLTGSLCDTLTGSDNGQPTLEMLERANLFIVSLDQERRWFRYHRLFGDLLRQQLNQIYPDDVAGLHRQASAWYEQHGFADEAITHALQAGTFERAARLIEIVAEDIWERGQDFKLRRWLAALPADLVLARPQLCIYHAWSLLARGLLDEADRVLRAAELALESEPNHKREDGRIATTRAFSAFYRGDIPAIAQQARRALDDLPAQDSAWRSAAVHILGDAYDLSGEMDQAYRARLEAVEASRTTGNSFQIMIVNLKLAIILRHQGHLQRVIEICTQQMQRAAASGLAQTVVTGWLLTIWGEALAELNDLDMALRQAQRGVEITERGGDLAMLGWSYLCLIRVLFSRGDFTEAEAVMHKLQDAARGNAVPPWIITQAAAWQARLWLAQDKPEAAARALNVDADPTYPHESETMALARILIAQERLEEAAPLLQSLLQAAHAGGRTARAIEICALQALAFQAQADTGEALSALADALALAEPGGFVRVFVDEGPPMAHLLYEAARRDIAPDYTRRLLAAFPAFELEPPRPAAAQEMIEPLSDRELEVLQLIAEGLANQDIADRLFLSLHTVKVHARNINSKLGVRSRTQAVARARTLGILPLF